VPAVAPPAGHYKHGGLPTITCPLGKVISYNCGTSNGTNHVLSRLDNVSETGQTLESYGYLGAGTVVIRTQTQPGTSLTYVKLSGESDGDAGDKYTGLDRFGRVVGQRWVDGGGTAVDWYQCSYDLDSHVTSAPRGAHVTAGYRSPSRRPSKSTWSAAVEK
jgi:hypothetical protein